LALSRIRRPDGGRKPILEPHPELDDIFLQVIHDHTAGLPTDAKVKWTNQSRPGLAEEGVSVSLPVIDQLPEKHDFCKRKAFKTIPGSQHPDRDARFQNIHGLIQEVLTTGRPVLSMDVKKKELIG